MATRTWSPSFLTSVSSRWLQDFTFEGALHRLASSACALALPCPLLNQSRGSESQTRQQQVPDSSLQPRPHLGRPRDDFCLGT